MNTQIKNKACQLINAKELAKLLSTSVRTIWRYRASGVIPEPVTIGSSVRWKLSDIQLFLECNCDMVRFRSRKEKEKCLNFTSY